LHRIRISGSDGYKDFDAGSDRIIRRKKTAFSGLLHDKFSHVHCPSFSQPNKINPVWQINDIILSFEFGDLPGDEFLTAKI
jgi:hypothetical protein